MTLPAESLVIEADTVRLAQVIGNLLTNAAKYTDPGGQIAVSAERVDDRVVVRVRDNGIGIEPAMQAHVFDLFVQVDHTATRAQGGLGIGLTLARNLVEMHNGSLEVRSQGLGTGTEMVLPLPLVAATPTPDLADALGGDGTQDVPPREVLVVDDNADAAESLAWLLRAHGHRVHVVGSRLAALEIVAQQSPDIAFVDIGMPGMDGYDVARRIRRLAGERAPVLVALTGWGQEHDRRRSAEAGFDQHLVKPPAPQDLYALLASFALGRVSETESPEVV